MKEQFELKDAHIKLLSKCYIDWDYTEFGAPCIDPKRPYGNGDVIRDMAEILKIKPAFEKDDEFYFSTEQDRELEELHNETKTALQIILCCKTFKPGLFKMAEDYDVTSWKRI